MNIVIAIIILLVYTLVMIKIGGSIPPSLSASVFNLTMSGFSVPMESVDTTTIQDYYILKSVNQYDGNFNITI